MAARARRVDGLTELADRFGEGALADKFLTQWLADPDAREKWERLGAMVSVERLGKLTRAELDVATGAACGYTNQEIADQRRVAGSTVKTQMRTAIKKVGARNRAHLAAIVAGTAVAYLAKGLDIP